MCSTMADNTVYVPIVGLHPNKIQQWQTYMDSFLIHQRPVAALKNIQCFFGDDGHWGILSSVTILKSLFSETSKFTHKISVIEEVQHALKTCQTLYKTMKDHKAETGVDEIFLDCKERLTLILEAECGCADCANLIITLQKATAFMRPPKLNPHHKHSKAATFLTWTYNQVVLNLDVAVIDSEVKSLFIPREDFFDFYPTIQTELSLLTSCLNFCWLYYILKKYVTMEVNMLQDQMIKTCVALGIPNINSLDEFHQQVVKSSSCKKGHFHHHVIPAHLMTKDPLLQIEGELQKDYNLKPETLEHIFKCSQQHRTGHQRLHLMKMHNPHKTHIQETYHRLGMLNLTSNTDIGAGKKASISHSFSRGDHNLSSEQCYGEVELILSDDENTIELQISDDEDNIEGLSEEDLDEEDTQESSDDEENKQEIAVGGVDLDTDEEAPFYELDRFEELLYADSSKTKEKKKNKKERKHSVYFREDL
nr:homolog of EHV2 ORF48 tegument protein G48 [Macronycteris gammaherpesvirus 1]